MLIIHGGGIKDTTFIENSANKGEIVGIYPQDSYLYDDWAEKSQQPCPYKRRRLVLVYLVNDKGVPAHKKPLILSLRRCIKEFVSAYNRFLEQLGEPSARSSISRAQPASTRSRLQLRSSPRPSEP